MKIGIVGLGLIGGSLGLDLTKQGYEVIGVSRQQSTCDIALQKQIVCEASCDLSTLAQTDLIFVCTPIASILPMIERIIPHLYHHTIITDVGSVKGAIVNEATQIWSNFVGSHPMAGTANQGIQAAQFNLFQGAPCVITPLPETKPEAVTKVTQIWQTVGCKIYRSHPKIHDQAVAWISHLPVMISANLIDSCIQHQDQEVVELAKHLASSGFRDTSRVGGGNVELGLMMAQYNRQQLLDSLRAYQSNLEQIISYIDQENWQDLQSVLENSQLKRSDFVD